MREVVTGQGFLLDPPHKFQSRVWGFAISRRGKDKDHGAVFCLQVVLRMGEKKKSQRSINHLWALGTVSKVVLLLSQDVSESRVQSGFQTFGEGLRKSGAQDTPSAGGLIKQTR